MTTLNFPPFSIFDLAKSQAYLSAVRFFPRHSERHDEYIEAIENTALINVLKTRGCPINPSTEQTAALVRAATGRKWEDIVRDYGKDLFQNDAIVEHQVNGKTVGTSHLVYSRPLLSGLLLVLSLSIGSLNAAIEKFSTAGGVKASVYGRSPRLVKDLWKEFSPAAHLNAIWLFFPDLRKLRRLSELSVFLAWADALRVLGESHVSLRAKKPILNSAETWKVPGWLPLPNVPLPDLPDASDLLAALGKQRADPDWSSRVCTSGPIADLVSTRCREMQEAARDGNIKRHDG